MGKEIPVTIDNVIHKLRKTLTKLTDSDMAYYEAGRRDEFLDILTIKYNFTPEQAENLLSSIERQQAANADSISCIQGNGFLCSENHSNDSTTRHEYRHIRLV